MMFRDAQRGVRKGLEAVPKRVNLDAGRRPNVRPRRFAQGHATGSRLMASLPERRGEEDGHASHAR